MTEAAATKKVEKEAPSAEDLLLMIDFTPAESKKHHHPIISHFEEVVEHYIAWAKHGSVLTRALALLKYNAILTNFCHKHQLRISKDHLGQFVKLEGDEKLRPIDRQGRALLWGAHYYRIE